MRHQTSLVYNTIRSIFEGQCSYNSNILKTTNKRDIGMHFVVRIRGNNYGFESDGNTYHTDWEKHVVKYVHIILHSCYRLYVAIMDNARTPTPDQYINISNHVSCYISDLDNILFKVVCEIHEQISSATDPEHRESINDSDIGLTINDMYSFNIYQYVQLTRAPLPDNDYLDQLTDIKPLKFNIVIE